MQRLMPASRRVVASVAEVVGVAEVARTVRVVGHGVAAVVGRRPRRQQRHQVQVRHAELGEVVDVLGDAWFRVPPNRSAYAAYPSASAALEPVRLGQPPGVELVQLGRPGVVRRPRDRQEPLRDGSGSS